MAGDHTYISNINIVHFFFRLLLLSYNLVLYPISAPRWGEAAQKCLVKNLTYKEAARCWFINPIYSFIFWRKQLLTEVFSFYSNKLEEVVQLRPGTISSGGRIHTWWRWWVQWWRTVRLIRAFPWRSARLRVRSLSTPLVGFAAFGDVIEGTIVAVFYFAVTSRWSHNGADAKLLTCV